MRSKAEIIYTILSYIRYASNKYTLGYFSKKYAHLFLGYTLFIISVGYLISSYIPRNSNSPITAPVSIVTFDNIQPAVDIKKPADEVVLPTLDELRPVNKDFSVVIPRLSINTQVIDNVDPFNTKDYESKLNKGIAHAKDTVYPGQIGNIFLFAHSASEKDAPKLTNDFFYNLGDAKLDEEVFTVYKGEVRKYIVKKKVIIKPSEIEYLTNKYNREVLTLMTCWPAGDNANRLIVIAEPVN